MVTEIEIVEGHNSSDYFWIRPFLFTGTKESFDMTPLSDEISIQEDIVSGFLEYFFRKYYDNSLWYNPAVEPDHEYEDDFQWYLTYNFYTYETINKMCDEIQEMADLLEKDYKNPILDAIKPHFFFCLQCDIKCDICNGGECLFDKEKNVGIAIRFYRKFVTLMREMMNKNPQTNIISIMGP